MLKSIVYKYPYLSLTIFAAILIFIITNSFPKKTGKEDDINWFSTVDGSCRPLVEVSKEELFDPNTFEHVETEFYDSGNSKIVIMKYKGDGKNLISRGSLHNKTGEITNYSRSILD